MTREDLGKQSYGFLVHQTVVAQNMRTMQIERSPEHIGTTASGLVNEKNSGSHIPRLQVKFPKQV
jgi:hypothetical protein